MTLYTFDEKFAQGAQGEAFLDAFFKRWYLVFPATPEEQREGIDRYFVHLRQRRVLAIEYKTDERAGQTHNAFVETVSVDTASKPGWAVTSQADYLAYYIPGDGLVYIIKFSKLRLALSRWEKIYQTRQIKNSGYHTHGLIVPLHEFEKLSEAVLSV